MSTWRRIGIDVGGTHTDAVLLQKGERQEKAEIIAWAKHPTSADVTEGVATVLNAVLVGQDPSSVQLVSIGTTHLINAVLQRRQLARVSVLRLARPSCSALPPFTDWPSGLRRAVRHSELLAAGGINFDGSAITQLNEEEVKSFVRAVSAGGCRHFVVVGVFSPICPEQEKLAARWIAEAAPGCSVTMSHSVGRLGFLERENASILNESLKPVCSRTLRSFGRALHAAQLHCELYLTLNDGTVADVATCRRLPVSLISSGATNSMRGAAFLTGERNAIVADIGGTSTDVGLLIDGFPKPAAARVAVGGVCTNFPIPDVASVALGGGSVVRDVTSGSFGPDSVGFHLFKEGISFGGDTLTLTDVAVGLQRLEEVGNWRRVLERHNEASLRATAESARRTLAAVVERARVSKEATPLILVGGGSVLFQDLQELNGLPVRVPAHPGVVNAVGAALCDVSGSSESMLESGENREAKVRQVQQLAVEAALGRGAAPEGVVLADFQEIQLPYIPGGACRLTAKAIGPLLLLQAGTDGGFGGRQGGEKEEEEDLEIERVEKWQSEDEEGEEEEEEDTTVPRERNINADGVWHVNRYDVRCLSIGAGLLGCGGGGSPYLGRLMLDQLLQSGQAAPRIVSQDWLRRNCPADAQVASVAFMGSPTVLVEKLPSGEETAAAVQLLSSVKRVATSSSQQQQDASSQTTTFASVTALEIGGMNSMEPLLVAARLQLPTLDADGMGRAFPELQMVTTLIAGCSPTPSALADEFGDGVLALSCTDAKDLENKFREVCVSRGCAIGMSMCPLSVEEATNSANLIGGSYSRAWAVGDCVLRARRNNDNVVERLARLLNGCLLASGRILDVSRVTSGGFARGSLRIQGEAGKEDGVLIEFQNEFLLARSKQGLVLASTPDLILLMDADSGEPVATEELRYGLRVAAMASACAPQMRTEAALKVVGPQAFGFDGVEYRQCAEYSQV